jgi:hypothetical protein
LRAALEAVAAADPVTPFGTMKSYPTTASDTINSVEVRTGTESLSDSIHCRRGGPAKHLRAPPNSPTSGRYRSPYRPRTGSRSDPQIVESHELFEIGSGDESAGEDVFGPIRAPRGGARNGDDGSVRSRKSGITV